MKKFSKILSVALLVALVLSLGITSAFAADITINRDDSYNGDAGSETTYTYYKILDATITDLAPVDEETGAATRSGNVVYTVNSADLKAAIESTNLFTVSNQADDGLYYVTLTDANTSAVAIAAAFKTMVTSDTYKSLFTPHTVTAEAGDEGKTTTIEGLADGYYLITASNGKDLIVQTLGEDVVVNEKNEYPTITKEEMDPEVADAVYGTTAVNAGVGDTINYKVEVNVPLDANKDIVVTDTMSTGLTFNDDISIVVGTGTYSANSYSELGATDSEGHANYENVAAGSSDTFTWKYNIKPTADTLGKKVVFLFTATVNADAITNVKKNDVELRYGNYHQEDTVPYKTYKTAAYKYDGADYSSALANVEFTLQENGVDFPVKLHTDGYYYPATGEGASATVKTNTNGLILIRGLDNDKTYTLTETSNPNPGFNMLAAPVELTLVEDDITNGTGYAPSIGTSATDTSKAAELKPIENNKGTQLPSTGGIGTTIFYVVGGVLVLAAIILLVTKKRMSE